MDIRIKEPMYIRSGEIEHVVRPGTVGVEHKKVIYFYDVTRTVAAGFSREFCIENPQLFQISRNLSDKEVSVRDVLKIIDEAPLGAGVANELYIKIKSL